MNYSTVYIGIDVHKESFSLFVTQMRRNRRSILKKVTAHYSKVVDYLEAMRFHYGDDVQP